MIRSLCRSTAMLLTAALLAGCATIPATMPKNAQLAHDVYFSLHDATPAACSKLIDACHDKLAALPGVVFLAAGIRDQGLMRDVNDRDYDVSVHVFFRDRAAHDAYQEAPAHLEFIQQNRDNWRQVRVFDSTLTPR